MVKTSHLVFLTFVLVDKTRDFFAAELAEYKAGKRQKEPDSYEIWPNLGKTLREK